MTDDIEVGTTHLTDGQGRLVPKSMIREERLLEDQMVREMHAAAAAVHERLRVFKAGAFADLDAFLLLLAEKYRASRRSVKGNTTFQSFDGRLRVQLATGDLIGFGPELQVAKTLVDDCLSRWSEGSRDELRAIVNDAFEVGVEGKLRVDRILLLRRVKIEDPDWKSAMEAIGDAIRVSSTRRYVRFHSRATPDAPWQQLALDLAGA